MGYPVGVTTRSISFGSAVGLEDATDVAMTVTVKASRSLVWGATGTPVIAIGRADTSQGGAQQTITVPVTDQVGWQDGNGGVIDVSGGNQSHTYTATISYYKNGLEVEKKVVGPFALPTGAGTVDLDLLVPVATVQGPIMVPNLIGPVGPKGDQGDLAASDSQVWSAGPLDLSTWVAPVTKIRTLSGNVSITSLPATPVGTKTGTVTLILKQPASGGPYTMTWPASLEWANDAAGPPMPTPANSELMMHFFWTGTAWRGIFAGYFFP